MKLELDHIFVCASPEAPEADELVRFGFREGEPNTHPGQGTACRRFPFLNAMIELIWVSVPAEAQSPATRRTLLWERWSGRNSGASPFGICLRSASPPSPDDVQDEPFPGWNYKPSYLPETLAFQIGSAGIDEPMWVYLSFVTRQLRREHFVGHPNGIREITGLVLNTPTALHSEASRISVENGVISARPANEPLLEIEFDHRHRGESRDFRPRLPFVFHF